MRNKIVMIAAMLAVMVAMTGIAAANPFNLAIVGGSNPLELAPGTSTVLDLKGDTFHAYDITASTAFTYSFNVTCITTGCDTSKVAVTFPVSSNITAAAGEVVQPGNFKVEVLSSSPVGDEYLIILQAGPNGAKNEFGIATRGVQAIPEFPTVALPVAAIIGLVFLFQQKKKKEE
jgi:hypothetical protein